MYLSAWDIGIAKAPVAAQPTDTPYQVLFALATENADLLPNCFQKAQWWLLTIKRWGEFFRPESLFDIYG